uniref:alpha-amylase n=1 Tax=Heterorhabditis bacteriophora TaxID=37862 RepID=A0A1I7XIS3_HETBA
MISPFIVFLLIRSILSSNVYWYDKTQLLADRQTIVHLFEWKWTDVAMECENFLQYYGYGAVQISPPMEHITLVQNNDMPWWIRYQPVSYKLVSRSGNESEFKDMVDRCNRVGVRIVVDVVLNHMVGVSQKSGVDGRKSSGGTLFDGTDGIESFPGVRNCRLVGLFDLDQGKQKVRNSIVAYLNKLIDYGIAGFRYTNFNFGAAVSEAAKRQTDWKNLANLGPGYRYGNNEDHDVLNFIDNHDNQRDAFPYVVTYKDGEAYKMAVAFMLAWPYGYPRVMSSFFFNQQNQGPPNFGANSGYATTSPIFNSDLTCDSKSGWVCEHRWPSIS